jgi:hypothetical protein
MFNAKQLYLWVLLAVQKGTSDDTSPQVICAHLMHLMAYTEVLDSFKSLVFVSRVFELIRGGGRRSSAALLVMTFCVLRWGSRCSLQRCSSRAFMTSGMRSFCSARVFFAVPEFCADLNALRWCGQMLPKMPMHCYNRRRGDFSSAGSKRRQERLEQQHGGSVHEECT